MSNRVTMFGNECKPDVETLLSCNECNSRKVAGECVCVEGGGGGEGGERKKLFFTVLIVHKSIKQIQSKM